MVTRCINLRDWESRRMLSLAAGETAVLVRPARTEDYLLVHGDYHAGEPNILRVKHSDRFRVGDTLVGREACHRTAKSCWVLGEHRVDAWAFDVDNALVAFPEMLGARDADKCPAVRLPADCARHRLTIVSVAVKRCKDLTTHEIYSGVDLRTNFTPEGANAVDTWPEKRFPWSTSHAWVLTVRG